MRRTFGNVRQLPSGRFQARYPLNGERVTLKDTFEDRKAAHAALSKVEADLLRGTHIDPAKAEGALGAWWEHYAGTKTDWADRTRQEREGLWNRHIEGPFASKPLAGITTTSIRSWHAALHAEHPPTATGAYRLLRQVLAAAVEDGRLIRNPCRIAGAGADKAPERKTATLAEVETIVANLPEHVQLMPLLATYCGLRSSELHALRRCDFDPMRRTVTVARSMHQLDDGSLIFKEPKTKAGRRTVAYPASIAAEVADHLDRFVGPDRDALVFTGERSGEALRPTTFGKFYRKARLAAGRPDLHLHDLRHTSLTLAAATGASLAELMYRAGHATPHAALRYQHASEERDKVISDALSELRPVAPVVDIAGRARHGE